MNASTPVPVLLISAQADAETISAIEALLARMEPLLLERRTLDEWLENPRSETRLVCLLSDAELRRLLADARVGEWQIAVLPIKTNRGAQISFGVPANLSQALKGALEMENPTEIDLLTCNGQIMLSTLVIGDVWGLNEPLTQQHLWRNLIVTLGQLRNLHLQSLSITTGKGQSQDLAAMGVMVFGHNPGMTECANQLSAGDHIDNLPTCGVFTAQFDITAWSELILNSGQDAAFDYPKNHP